MNPQSGLHKTHEGSFVGLKESGLVKELPYLVIVLIPLIFAYSASGVMESARGLASYAPLHTSLELIAIIVAVTVFLVGWFGSLEKRSIEASVLPAFFLCVAILDITHALSYPGMPDLVTVNTPHKAILAWLMARLVAAIALLLVAYIYWHGQVYSSSWRSLSLIVSLLVASLGSFFVIYYPDWFPVTFIAGEGLTPIKVNIEYLLILMNLSAGIVFIYARQVPRYIFNVRYLAWAAFLMAVSEWCFTLYAEVTDLYNLVGHLYKVMAYVFILRVLVIGLIARPVNDLRLSETRIKEIVNQMSIFSGAALFQSVLAFMLGMFRFETTLIACVKEDDPGLIVVDAFQTSNEKVEPVYTYNTVETPCGKVLKTGQSFYSANIQAEFPGYFLIKGFTVQTYVGVPLIGADDRVLGVLVGLDSRKRDDIEEFRDLLTMFAKRVSMEMERIESDKKLKQSEMKLRELANHMANMREDERREIARDLHDELGGNLVGFAMDIGYLEKRLSVGDVTGVENKLKDMSQIVESSIGSLRRIMTELRPAVLDDFGLSAAIEWQFNEFCERYDISGSLDIMPDIPLSKDDIKETAIFRIFQESLNNIARHSSASMVKVTLQKNDGELLLCVEDNGVGMPAFRSQRAGSFGIQGMQERAMQISGNLEFGVSPLGGVKLTLTIPL